MTLETRDVAEDKAEAKGTNVLRVTPIQWLPKAGSPSEALNEVLNYLKKNIKKNSTDIIVFPELFLQHIDGDEAFIDEARKKIVDYVTTELGCGLVITGKDHQYKAPTAHTVESSGRTVPAGVLSNAAWIYSREGELVHTYHKQKLVNEEESWEGPLKNGYFEYPCPFHKGNCNHTIPMAILICADFENPKIFSSVFNNNARKPEVILNPAWTPSPGESEEASIKGKKSFVEMLYSASQMSTVIRTDYPAAEFGQGGSSMVVNQGQIMESPIFPYGEWMKTYKVPVKISSSSLVLDHSVEIEKRCKELESNQEVTALAITINSDKDAEALAKMLMKNTSISSLKVEIGKNSLGFSTQALTLLGDALSKNATITTLDLSNCKISSEAAVTLLPKLAANHSITSLYLDNNPLGEEMGAICDLISSHSNLKILSLINVGLPPEVDSLLEALQTQKENLTHVFADGNRDLPPHNVKRIKEAHLITSYVSGDTPEMRFLRRSPETGFTILKTSITNIRDSKTLESRLNTKNMLDDNFTSIFAKLYPEVFPGFKSMESLEKDIEQLRLMASESKKASAEMKACLALIQTKLLGKEVKETKEVKAASVIKPGASEVAVPKRTLPKFSLPDATAKAKVASPKAKEQKKVGKINLAMFEKKIVKKEEELKSPKPQVPGSSRKS